MIYQFLFPSIIVLQPFEGLIFELPKDVCNAFEVILYLSWVSIFDLQGSGSCALLIEVALVSSTTTLLKTPDISSPQVSLPDPF